MVSVGKSSGEIQNSNAILLPLQVLDVTPPNAAVNVPASTNLTATFSGNIDGATATLQTFVVHGAQRGRLDNATFTTSSTTVILDPGPGSEFFPGEEVQATVTSGIQAVSGA